jgi:hypothetical protein
MRKRWLLAQALVLSVAFGWQATSSSENSPNSGILEPCSTTAIAAGGCYLVCPHGDGVRLDGIGSVIYVVVKDMVGAPIPGIPASDFWLVGCNIQLNLCGGGGAIDADSMTNAEGKTTISGSLAAGGCEPVGVWVVMMGVIIPDPLDCMAPLCLPISSVSPDVDGDGEVQLNDFSAFAIAYPSPPKPLQDCADFDCNGLVELIDFSIFAQHYLHQCL